jgi:hypothetical protein
MTMTSLARRAFPAVARQFFKAHPAQARNITLNAADELHSKIADATLFAFEELENLELLARHGQHHPISRETLDIFKLPGPCPHLTKVPSNDLEKLYPPPILTGGGAPSQMLKAAKLTRYYFSDLVAMQFVFGETLLKFLGDQAFNLLVPNFQLDESVSFDNHHAKHFLRKSKKLEYASRGDIVLFNERDKPAYGLCEWNNGLFLNLLVFGKGKVDISLDAIETSWTINAGRIANNFF